jgi:demethylmenaquinone methyltransferase/2-methoxy-6-polyprenyl-1,4-benzoquinol methylase
VFSYIFMKILERRPRSYDQRMDRASRGRVRQAKQAVASAVPENSRVLEIGCGTGELASLLVARGCTVLGFDLSGPMVQAARERIEREDLKGKFEVRQMGVEGMDRLEAESFDAAVSTLVLTELTDDERRYTLKHAHRVLKPEGLLVVADEVVPRTHGRRILHRLFRAPLHAATYLVTRASTRPLKDLPSDLESAGFCVEKEIRNHGDAFALVTTRKPGGESG